MSIIRGDDGEDTVIIDNNYIEFNLFFENDFLVIEQKSTNQKNTFSQLRWFLSLILMLQSIMITKQLMNPFVNYDKSFGQSGDDYILGSNNSDFVLSGGGNDIISVGGGDDAVFIEGQADEAVKIGRGNDTVRVLGSFEGNADVQSSGGLNSIEIVGDFKSISKNSTSLKIETANGFVNYLNQYSDMVN